jgi:hypothetical protein
MKLPLWVKDRGGKWHRFPYETLTWKDGRYIIHHDDIGPLLKLCDAAGWDLHQFCKYDNDHDLPWGYLVLKEAAGEEK